MKRYLTATLAIICLLLFSTALYAAGDKDKKKGKEAVQAYEPTPDLRLVPLKPQKSMPRVQELGNFKDIQQQSGTASIKGSYGPHKQQSRGGIDVSHYQGQIDWSQVARDGKTLYVFCKSTENTSFVDNTFEYNVRECNKYKIPVGCYHFFNPQISGAAQFEHFKRTVDMSKLDVVPMLDVEVRGKESLEAFQANIRQWIKGFEATYHFKPIIYASLHFYNKYLAGAFDDYIYMIAKYGEGTPNPQGPIPFAMWQYTSSGSVSGIRGRVDMSCFIDHFDVKDILIKNQRKL